MGWNKRYSYTRAATVGCVALLLTTLHANGSERVTVPIPIQAELLQKIAAYDRNLEARAVGQVNVLILVKHGSPDSRRAATQMQDALSAFPSIGSSPHTELVETFTNGPALLATCHDKRISIVFVSPGFEEEMETIRQALDGQDILSAGAVASYVPHGVVLGFDLVSGKTKLLVDLAQARKQHVAFKAEVLKLMTVFE